MELTSLKLKLRMKFSLPTDKFLCGNFQRDTEGAELQRGVVIPKLEKGPDLFCDAVEEISTQRPDLHVVLAGWRREYVLQRLESAKIPYTYFERPSLNRINELYNALDLYVVASRYEGGPQAIVECAAIGVPVVSRDVGVAAEVLHPSCVGDDLASMVEKARDPDNVSYAFDSAAKLFMPQGFVPFVEFFSQLDRRSAFSRVSPGIGERKSDV